MQRLLGALLALLIGGTAAFADVTPGALGVATSTLVGGKLPFDQGPGTDTALGFTTTQFCLTGGALVICNSAITNAMLAGSIDPAKLTVGTGVAAALGINVGSAGAFVTFNGAGGTPSSINLANATALPLTAVTGLGTNVATALGVAVGTAGAFLKNNGDAITGTYTGAPTITGNWTFSGVPKLTGLSTGTQVSCLGLDSGNSIVLLTGSCGTGGGGSGNVTAAAALTNGQIVIGQSSVAIAVDPGAALSGGALSLGASGTAGSVSMGNATSGTVTIQPVAGALGSVTASLPANSGTIAELNLAQTWSAAQSFNDGTFLLKGLTSGTITLKAAAAAGSNTITWPAGTTDFSTTGVASGVVKQTSAGGAFTVGRLACSDLADASNGCSGGTPVIFVGTTAGSANTQTIAAPTPTGFTFTDGFVVVLKVGAALTNTAAATLNLNTTGAKAVATQDADGALSALIGGELRAGDTLELVAHTSCPAPISADCYVITTTPGNPAPITGSATITAAQWGAWQQIVISSASQTITLPAANTLSPKGGLIITTIGNNPLTLTPAASDGFNGQTINTSATVPGNVTTVITTPGSTGVNAFKVPLGPVAGTNITITDNASGTKTFAATGGGSLINNAIGGCTLSRSSATVVGISACTAADSTNAATISFGAFTKSTAGAWASGSGSNGMGNGLTVSNNTWYHICAANNGGTGDAYLDTSVSCANRPSGISDTKVRRIGSVLTNGSAQILDFVQRGDLFVWNTPIVNANNQTYTTTPTLVTVSTPPGIASQAFLSVYISQQVTVALLLYDPDATGSNPPGSGNLTCAISDPTTTLPAACTTSVVTNTTPQIDAVAGSGTATGVYINTISYRDFRGQ